MEVQEMIKQNDKEIKKLKKKIREKKKELKAQKERNEEEIERLRYEAEILRQRLKKKKKFLDQRTKDWEADGCPPMEKEMDPAETVVTNIFFNAPDGKRVLVDYGDKPYIKPPFKWPI